MAGRRRQTSGRKRERPRTEAARRVGTPRPTSKRPKRQPPAVRVRPHLVLPIEWFEEDIADDLWMPERESLERVQRPERRPRQTRQKRRRGQPRRRRARAVPATPLPASQADVRGLTTSWFGIRNYTDQHREASWRTASMPQPRPPIDIAEELRASAAVADDEINSVLKLRLYPSAAQKQLLEQMFATNRAVYNKLVALSKDDRLTKMRSRDKKTRMNLKEFAKKYAPIARAYTMGEYFRNSKKLRRYLQVNNEVRNSALRDFVKAVKSSRAAYFKLLDERKRTTYPDLKFRSKFARSCSIALEARDIKRVRVEGAFDRIRFHPKFFGFKETEGIALREALPDLEHDVRLQRCRGGRYYVIVPRHVQHPASNAERVCALDPGVRNFVTLYDPAGRVLSVTDSSKMLKKRFDLIDKAKSCLAKLDNVSKSRHKTRIHTRVKRKKKRRTKTAQHRQRYRLRRLIRTTLSRVTRLVNDMHQKLSSWLAANYYNVLLPSFQTADMVRKYFAEVDGDAGLATAEDAPSVALRKRKISSPTARSMMCQAHYQFKEMLKKKMARAGGRAIICGEEYTSKTCSACGTIKHNLGGNKTYRCRACSAVLDRDVNAAKNIFHKNMVMLG